MRGKTPKRKNLVKPESPGLDRPKSPKKLDRWEDLKLGGGFKYFLIFIPIWGRFHFDKYFSIGLKPPTRKLLENSGESQKGNLWVFFVDVLGGIGIDMFIQYTYIDIRILNDA